MSGKRTRARHRQRWRQASGFSLQDREATALLLRPRGLWDFVTAVAADEPQAAQACQGAGPLRQPPGEGSRRKQVRSSLAHRACSEHA